MPRPSRTHSILAGKRKKLLAQSRKALAQAQAESGHHSTASVAHAATQLRGEIAGLRRQIEAEPGAGPHAAARALADLEHTLAALANSAHARSPAKAMEELKSGYLALISAKHAAKQAGHDWPL